MTIIKTEHLGCKVNPKIKKKVEEVADKLGVTMSEFIRLSVLSKIGILNDMEIEDEVETK